jgi:DNA-binding response OmpR family regulator
VSLLLVEDDPTDVFFMKRALGKLLPGVLVHTASNGDAAVEFLSHSRPSHVFLDLKLPQRSGFEVIEWIRSREELAGLPIVILTSSSEKKDIVRAKDLGVEDYRIKPVGNGELLEMMRDILVKWGLL